MTVLYPSALATTHSPMPVLPAVPSTMVPPGFKAPDFSAARMMKSAARSLTDWPGFINSALPKIVQPVSSEAWRNLMRGVLPMASMTEGRMFMADLLKQKDRCFHRPLAFLSTWLFRKS